MLDVDGYFENEIKKKIPLVPVTLNPCRWLGVVARLWVEHGFWGTVHLGGNPNLSRSLPGWSWTPNVLPHP